MGADAANQTRFNPKVRITIPHYFTFSNRRNSFLHKPTLKNWMACKKSLHSNMLQSE